MKFLKALTQKKLAKAVVCGLVLSGGMLAGMGQADAATYVLGADSYGVVYIGHSRYSVLIDRVSVSETQTEYAHEYIDRAEIWGYSPDDSGDLKKGIVDISGGNISGAVYGCYSYGDADAVNNSVAVNGGELEGLVYGGFTYSGTANNNTVTVTGGKLGDDVYGGSSVYGNANKNDVTVDGGEVSGYVYGGNTGTGNVEENKITINKGTITGVVFGGYASGSGQGNANKNTITVTGGEIDNQIYGGYSRNGNADENTLTITGDNTKISSMVLGGYGNTSACKNKVDISGGKVQSDVYVGRAKSGNANNNTVTISGGEVQKDVRGGRAISGNANNNTVTISGDAAVNGYVIGGEASGDANNNTITINGGTVGSNNTYLVGGYASGDVKNNTITINKGTIKSVVYGGYSDEGTVVGNTVTINDGKIAEEVNGGNSYSGNVAENTVTISGGDIRGIVYGGNTKAGNANKNTVTISGGSFNNGSNARVFGGKCDYDGVTNGNTVTISGGASFEEVAGGYSSGAANDNKLTFNGSDNTKVNFVTGGFASEGDVKGNEITFSGSGMIEANRVFGGMTEVGTASKNVINIGGKFEEDVPVFASGKLTAEVLCGGRGHKSEDNTVNVFSTGNKVGNIESVQNLNFYIPATAKDGDVMLSVNSSVNLEGTAIKAGLHKDTTLPEQGSRVTLISAKEIKGVETDKIETIKNGFFDKELTYELVEDKVLNAVFGTDKPGEDSKSPVETQAAGLTMLTTGADMLASAGFDNAASAVANEVSAGASPNVMTPFMAMGGAKSKVKSGSHVDVKGWNLNVGLAKEIDNKAGKLLIGPVVEYGKGSYDSYLDSGLHGEGDTHFIGGGVMAKQTNDNGFYYEGSLRAGKLSNDYKSAYGSYDSDSTYYAAHAGLGKIMKLSDKNSLDYYGKYFYTHQKGDSTTLHAGGVDYDLRFDSVDSNRTRIGGRFTHDVNEKNAIYAGLAWQYEFSGTARATMNGQGTPAPSIKGSTGIMELGWKVNANKNLDLDLGATGYTGKQKGASLNLALNFKF